MSDRIFTMQLGPTRWSKSSVYLDGVDLSKLLRGVDVHSDVENGTSVTLIPVRGAKAELTMLLPEAQVIIEDDHVPLSPRDGVVVGDRILFDAAVLQTLADGRTLLIVEDIQTAEDGTKTLQLEYATAQEPA